MEKIIKQYECGQELMADDLNDIISLGNDIILYIKDHESGWENNSNNGNNVQITPLNSSGQRIAKFKIDNNPEEYIYAPSNSVTPGLNGDTTIIEPLNFEGDKVAIANFTAGNGSNTLYAPKPRSGNNGLNGQNGLDGLSTLFAFKGFANDSDAESDWNNNFKNSRDYPPSGWSISSNVLLQTGHMLYMTTAQRLGNNYTTTNGAIWQRPVRIGSDGSTSTTGTDDDNYNYIYCRTTTNVAPGLTGIVGQSSYGVHLLELIEADTVKGHGYKPVNDNSIDIANAEIKDINGAWTDHPYGVSIDLPFEWQVGFKKNETSGNWEYYFGPVIISHYGHDGLDGDGLEYIFYLLAKNLAGIPSLGEPYKGRVGENSNVIYEGVYVTGNTKYQEDDFIPVYNLNDKWHDNPQTVSEEYPRQYVSIRKKDGSQEANNLWQAFSTPRLWNIYATNGFLATLDNDSIILDDDNGSEAIKFVSLTKVFLWDGANDVTLSNNYAKVTVEINCVGFTSLLKPGLVTSIANNNVLISSNSNEVGWEKEIEINKNAYYGFALTKTTSGNPKLSTGTGSITYTIRAYKNVNDATPEVEASRVQTIQVVDINNGVAYLLQVTPNTLGVERTDDSSPYALRSGNSSIVVTATAATETSVEGIEIKNGSTNASDGDLYVVVSNSGGTSLGITPTVSNNNKTLTYDLSSLLNLVTTIAYVTVDLYYMYNNTGIKVDSETVDFSIKGDKGPAGQGSGTESYVVTTLNDNAVIDDLTVGEYALRGATLYTLTVYKGSDNVTSNCRFVPSNVTLPTDLNSQQQQLILGIRSGNQTVSLNSANYSDNNVNTFVLYAANGVTNITPGSYYYDVNIYHYIDANNSTLVATKRFKLYVDANISSDGSYYKLKMENDVVYYTYDETSLSIGNIIITPYKVRNDVSSLSSLAIYLYVANINNVQNIDSSKLYLEVGGLSSVNGIGINNYGGVYIPRANISYNANGYEVTLYKGNLYVEGPERIDCIKYGSPGDNGDDAYTITSNNDNSTFGIFMTDNRLNIASSQTLTVYKGSQDVTSNCTYRVSANNLVSNELKILYSTDGSSWADITNNAVQGANNFRVLLAPLFNSSGKNFTPGKYYYDVTITHGSYSTTKRHKITVRSDYYSFILNFEPDGLIYDENNNVISTSDPKIKVFDRLGDECEFRAVESLPLNTDPGTLYAVMGPLLNYLKTKPQNLVYYEVNRTLLPYNSGGYPVILYFGEEIVDGPEIFSCVKEKPDLSVYNLEPYPTTLKFNVNPENKYELTPSELVARCKISKKVGNNDYTFSNNSIDGYYIYYNITDKDGHLKNISGIDGNDGNGWYVIYNNSDDVNAGLHISKNNLNYTLVNFYLSKAKTLDLLTQLGDLYYTNNISPIVKQVSIPIIRDGLKGDSGESSTGLVGKFYYFAGDWNDVSSSGLVVSEHLYPYVYYNGDYFMYVGDPSTTNPYIISKSTLGTPSLSNNWEEITYNKFLISEAMFAKYAQLGALIVNRDWMISQYGTYNGSPSWSAYVNFDPIAFMTHLRPNEGASIGVIPYISGSSSGTPCSQLFQIRQSATISVTVSGTTQLVKVSDYRQDNSLSLESYDVVFGFNGSGSTTISNPDANAWYCFIDGNVSDIKVKYSNVASVFIPNYAVDLRSGLTYLNNAYVKGKIEASEGKIGGFTIGQKELTNNNWQAGIDIEYDNKVVKIGKNAQGTINTESAIIRAENTKSSLTYNTALYLNSLNATYNYAFYGNGNGVLNGFVAGFKPLIITIPSGSTESNSSRILIRQGSFVVIKGSHTSGHVLVGMPTLTEIRNTLGINNITPFFFELSVISYSTYEHIHLAFRGESGNSGSEYPVLMGYNDSPKMDGINQQTYWQIALGDYFKILLTYIENTSGVLDYRAYVLSNLN